MMPKQPSSPKPRKKTEETKSAPSKSKTGSIKKTAGRKNTPAVEATAKSRETRTLDAQTIANNGDLRARIAQRAYELYERRGGHHGQDLDDWVAAEREVLAQEP